MKPGLKSLIAPKSLDEFQNCYNKNLPFIVNHKLTDLEALASLPLMTSIETLLNSWPAPIEAHLPDLRDESSAISTTAIDAKKLFDNGMGLLFNEAQNFSPVLKIWLDQIRSDLGLSALSYGRCLIYVTPDGKGTAAHFDQNINFVLQIHGTKIWKMAPNSQVINPMTRHTMGQEIDPEMMSYMSEEMPSEMPSDAQTFELKPGSLLFVPRGYWHSTLADGDSLALNFTYTAPAWIDLFMSALRSRLLQSELWRETANGVGDPAQRSLCEAKLGVLLSELIDDLPHWRARDILDATEPDSNT